MRMRFTKETRRQVVERDGTIQKIHFDSQRINGPQMTQTLPHGTSPHVVVRVEQDESFVHDTSPPPEFFSH